MERKDSQTVLVVDDDRMVLRLVVTVLHSKGFRVLEAHSGENGLKVFRENSHQIQLVLTDVVMPTMPGPEMVRRILEIDPAMRIILMTGTAAEANLPDSSQQKLLHKPFSMQRLLHSVDECLGEVV